MWLFNVDVGESVNNQAANTTISENNRDPAMPDISAYQLILAKYGQYQPENCIFVKLNNRRFRKEWYISNKWLESNKKCYFLLLL